MSVTLQEVADRAGVTPPTVSRVLNGRIKENRPAIARRADQIRRIAHEMGYRPNTAARSVSRGRFGGVAFVTCGDLGFDWFAPSLLHGIHEGLEAEHLSLTLNELPGERMTDANYIPRLFRESAVDGLLINLDAKLPDTLIDVFDRQPVPAVLLNLKRSTRCVYPDEVGGGAAAARHVIATGCRRVGFLMHDPINERSHFSRADRLRGVADTLQEAEMPPLRPVVGEAAFDRGSGRGVEMAEALLATRAGWTRWCVTTCPRRCRFIWPRSGEGCGSRTTCGWWSFRTRSCTRSPARRWTR